MAGVCETKDCGQFHSSACPLPSQALNNLLHNLQLTVARPGICSDAADVMRHTSVQQSVRRYKMHDACTFHSVQPLLFSPLCNTDNILDTQAYWPFHRMSCHKNEFADAVEEAEPKFAGWMRSHGKLAVLKDDEIERLERAGAATMGVSRAEVMDSMYNRLEPKPKGDVMSCRSPVALARLHLRIIKQVHSASLGHEMYTAMLVLNACGNQYKRELFVRVCSTRLRPTSSIAKSASHVCTACVTTLLCACCC